MRYSEMMDPNFNNFLELLLICRWFSHMYMTRNIVTSNIKGLHLASGGGSSKQRKKD